MSIIQKHPIIVKERLMTFVPIADKKNRIKWMKIILKY